MTERLNNDQIIQRITDSNYNLKRYLDLAPSFELNSSQPKTPTECSQSYSTVSPLFPSPVLKPKKAHL